MVELGRAQPRLPLGEDLVVGHVHAREAADTEGSSLSPRIKRRIRTKTSLAEIERKERGRTSVPGPPRLRSLISDAAETPISEGSLVPASTPTSGPQRAHPYTPVGNAVGSSSFEMVPSARPRAASDRGLNDSADTIPIVRANSSPSIIQVPTQVMSPNLVAGSASSAHPVGSGDTEAGVQAILQQWQEVKTEHGTVERTYTQCAQQWPLASHVKLESMESAIHILRQACEYLHEGMVRLGSLTEQKCDTGMVHQVVSDVMTNLQQFQSECTEGSRKVEQVTSRVNEIVGELVNARKRIEGLERRIGIESQQHDSEMRELRAGHERQVAEIGVLSQCVNEYQADIQLRDNETFEMKELIFELGVRMDEFHKEVNKAREAPEREATNISELQAQMGTFQHDFRRALDQVEALERKVQEGDQRVSQLQQEISVYKREPQPERHQGISDEIQRGIEDRLAKIEGRLTRYQQQASGWQEDSVRDFQAVEAYMDRIHKMIQELHQTGASQPTSKRARLTRLTAAAMKGDLRVEVEESDTFRVGEVVVLGEREAKMVVGKGSLIFRFPIEGDYPEGTVIRPLADDEFLQAEGDRLCVYRRGTDDDVHYVCRVDLIERALPERASEGDEAQDHAYGDLELDARIQRIIDAREASQSQGGAVSGVMPPPARQAPMGRGPFSNLPPELPAFGQGLRGSASRGEDQRDDAGRHPEESGVQERHGTSQRRVKQEDEESSPLDDYFCKGMDTSGPAAWATVLQDMTEGNLPDVGQVNAREGVREEKWVALDLRTIKFPPTQTSSVRRATLIQNFEADFIRAMGIISPAAALYAQAAIAGVQQDLPVYRKRDDRTTARDWTKRLPEERWHSRAEAVVNLQLQQIGISQECWDLARMLRHNPPVRLILMTAYHRLLPARSREEDDLHQYVKDPVAGDQGAVSTFQKLQLWKGAARRLRQMGGTLPGVTTLMSAFDKILAAFNLGNARGNWFYQTERNKMPMDDVSPEEAALFFHTVEVNLNQTTTVTGWLPHTAKAHAVDARPKSRPKAKAAATPEGAKSTSAPSTPLRSEGPAPPRESTAASAQKESPGKGKGKTDPDQAAKIAANKKGQQCIRFFRGNCTRGEACQYGHILGTDGKPLKIAPELLARYDRFNASKKGKGKGSFETQMLLLNAVDCADVRCYCLLDTGANALVVPKRKGMTGAEAQCTVPGGKVVSGMVVQVVACDGEDYHAVAIEGATPLMPLSWLLLLAGWKYIPEVEKGKIRVQVQSPEGREVELTEKSKMHYMDQETFWAVMADIWKRNGPGSGMTASQFRDSLLAREAPSDLNAVSLARPASIRFLEMKGGRRVYMKKIIDVQQAIQKMSWPYQNNRASIAGGSRALFLGAQTNRGLQQGCVVKRTFQERYQEVLLKVHALAASCSKELPYLGIYVTQLSAGQGLNRHKDYRNHEEYLNYTINFGQYEGGHLEMLRNDEWQSCAVPLVWTEFTADIIEHRVREVTKGERFSVTLFTPSHLERLSDRDWMNLESKGFPVHLYAGRASEVSKAPPEGPILEVEPDEATISEKQAQVATVDTSVSALETGPGRVEKVDEALSQLTDQIPRPYAVSSGSTGCSLQQLALLTREFNSAMGLPEGTSLKIVSYERGQQYGRMLLEEVREIEEAIKSGVAHDVLAELADVLYLTLNLAQECGMQDWMEDAFLTKHSDNMRKQHDSVTHVSWTRTAHARACNCTEDSLNFTVSRTNGGKWLLYSHGKLVKPYDYVPSDYSQLLHQTRKGEPDMGSDHPERASCTGHTSGQDPSQFTFANVGIQVSLCDSAPKGDMEPRGQHGWQPALMTSMMWLSNVVGEYLTKLSQPPEVAPVSLPRLIDDPVSTLEQTMVDLRIAQEARETSGVLKHIGLLMYYSVMMATSMRLHPYLSSTFLWIHEWQLSKIYDDFEPAESAWEMLKDVTMKEVKGGFVVLSNQSLKVLGDYALDDKADVAMMTPVESLLGMIPAQVSLPYTGLQVKQDPGRGSMSQETGETKVSSATVSTL